MVRIEMNQTFGGTQKFDNGREVQSMVKTIYIWKGEDVEKLKTFQDWSYTNFIRIVFGTKTMIVDEHMTQISLYGFTCIPDLKTLPGQPPKKLSICF